MDNPVLTKPVRIRPLRVPLNVPIGPVDPPYMQVGSLGTWRLSLRPGRDLVGDQLTLHLGGHRWVKLDMVCQNEDAAAEGYVSAKAGGRLLEPVHRPPPKRIHELMRVMFKIPTGGIGHDEELEFVLGDKSGGSPGLQGPRFYVRNVFLALTMQPRPAGIPEHELNWVGAFVLDHIGGPYEYLRALAPSQVPSNLEFDLTVRPQDRQGNISARCPQRLLLRYAGQEKEVEVVPEMFNPAGAIQVGGIVLPNDGVARIEVQDPETGTKTASNPIIVGGNDPDLYWGLIHEHTEISDGCGSLDLCYQNMRYGSRLDFGAASDHDHRFETTDEMWTLTQDAAERHNHPGAFTTLLGYEWAKWRRNGDGDRNVYYPSGEGAMYRSETGEYDTPGKLFEALERMDAIIIPHHTAYTGNFCDWKDHDPEREKLVEIYSVWGNSEMSASDGNPLPVRTGRDFDPRWIQASGNIPTLAEEPVGFVQNALAQGWRVGFTAGGDMHRSHPGDDVTRGFPPYAYRPGLTGVWATGNTRDQIYRALKERRCYATTGSRMVLKMAVNGHPMGSELYGAAGPRTITFIGIGTNKISRVELVRNNGVLRSENVQRNRVSLSWLDDDDFSRIALPQGRWSDSPFIFYYVRIIQEDGEMGWTSPVWLLE